MVNYFQFSIHLADMSVDCEKALGKQPYYNQKVQRPRLNILTVKYSYYNSLFLKKKSHTSVILTSNNQTRVEIEIKSLLLQKSQ